MDPGKDDASSSKTGRYVKFEEKGNANVLKISKGHKVIMVDVGTEKQVITIPESQDIDINEVLSRTAESDAAAMPPPSKPKSNFAFEPEATSTQDDARCFISPIRALNVETPVAPNSSLVVHLFPADKEPSSPSDAQNSSAIDLFAPEKESLNKRNDWATFITPEAAPVSQLANLTQETPPNLSVYDIAAVDEEQGTMATDTSLSFVPDSQSIAGDIIPVQEDAQQMDEINVPKDDKEIVETDSSLSLPPAGSQIIKDIDKIKEYVTLGYAWLFKKPVETVSEESENEKDRSSKSIVSKRRPGPRSKKQIDSDDTDDSQPMLRHRFRF